MNKMNNTPQTDSDVKKHIKELDKTFNLYVLSMSLGLALPIIELAAIYAVDFMKFDIFSFILIISSIFIFKRAFKGASLTARELFIYENMI
jgi:hypothetical protein